MLSFEELLKRHRLNCKRYMEFCNEINNGPVCDYTIFHQDDQQLYQTLKNNMNGSFRRLYYSRKNTDVNITDESQCLECGSEVSPIKMYDCEMKTNILYIPKRESLKLVCPDCRFEFEK